MDVLLHRGPRSDVTARLIGNMHCSPVVAAFPLGVLRGVTCPHKFDFLRYTADAGQGSLMSENLYINVNKDLRTLQQEGTTDEHRDLIIRSWSAFMGHFMAAFRCLPQVGNITVYRGRTDRVQVLEQYTVGRRVCWSSITSCSQNLKAAFARAGLEGCLMELQVSSARFFGDFSLYPEEQEVVLGPGTWLLVTGLRRQAEVDIVTLVEIAGPPLIS